MSLDVSLHLPYPSITKCTSPLAPHQEFVTEETTHENLVKNSVSIVLYPSAMFILIHEKVIVTNEHMKHLYETVFFKRVVLITYETPGYLVGFVVVELE